MAEPSGREQRRSPSGVWGGGTARSPQAVLWAALAALALALAGGACAPAFQPPSVEVLTVSVGSLGLSGGTAEVELRVGNPNRDEYRVRVVEYVLDVGEPGRDEGWETLAEGVSEKEVLLPAGDTVGVSLEVPFRYGGLGAAVRSLFRSGSVGYHVRGRVRVRGSLGEIVRPFAARGVVRP